MGLAEQRADAKLARQELEKTRDEVPPAIRAQLDNLLAIHEGLLTYLGEQEEVIGSLAADIDELVDQSGDMLQEETAAKILGVFEIGKLLAAELTTALPRLDDLAKKRARELVKTFRQGAEVVGEMIAEITIPEGDEIEEDEDENEPTEIGDGLEVHEEDEDEDDAAAEGDV